LPRAVFIGNYFVLNIKKQNKMGIWSRPICATYEGATECRVDVSKISPAIKNQLSHYGYFTTDFQTPVSIQDIHRETYDTAKIWGYFTDEKIQGWKAYFECILEQNPAIQSVQLHWEQTDDKFPYFLEMTRKDKKLYIYESSQQVYYFYQAKVDDETKEVYAEFQEDIYQKIWFLVRHQFKKSHLL
jgi:hypothetical protein